MYVTYYVTSINPTNQSLDELGGAQALPYFLYILTIEETELCWAGRWLSG